MISSITYAIRNKREENKIRDGMTEINDNHERPKFQYLDSVGEPKRPVKISLKDLGVVDGSLMERGTILAGGVNRAADNATIIGRVLALCNKEEVIRKE
tara:strand:- start:977 stop:1273 length:297 start_codon:yes stop_codon:yes gene_type:complete